MICTGDEVVKTVDIRTDCGYVLLQHDDEDVVRADYNRIITLQKTMLEIEESNEEDLPHVEVNNDDNDSVSDGNIDSSRKSSSAGRRRRKNRIISSVDVDRGGEQSEGSNSADLDVASSSDNVEEIDVSVKVDSKEVEVKVPVKSSRRRKSIHLGDNGFNQVQQLLQHNSFDEVYSKPQPSASDSSVIPYVTPLSSFFKKILIRTSIIMTTYVVVALSLVFSIPLFYKDV